MKSIELQTTSSYGIKNGTWFVFEDGSTIIHLHLEGFSGKEKVYLNNELVIERKNRTKIKADYKIPTNEGFSYNIQLRTRLKLGKTATICSLIKEGVVIEQLILSQNRSFKRKLRQTFYITLIFVVIAEVLRVVYKLPYAIRFSPILVFGVLFLATKLHKTQFMKIERTTEFLEE